MRAFLTAPRPIRRVLIANRGEIACRIIATCRRLGLETLAVHSDADAGALHVRLADRAIRIGPAPAVDSYLNIDAVIAAARAGGADAVHPGYGFLSENAGFVAACEAAGLIFVGPSAQAVAAMGSKIEARRIAQAAGVPVVPGFDAAGADDAAIARAAADLGYPVLVKASAGGGGRGMRRVSDPAGLAGALASARAEAGAAFGDATVFLEKLIECPRHLEVQVFGDGAGGALHFHERDCSVQRNHQKVIEEAPAPALPDALRAQLFDDALRLTRAIGYAGAGTVEFILGAGAETAYFLEMNTRLQVEHPVTEAICGVDLVEWQLRQAAGLPLELTQDQIRPRGHAIEVRLNAERPDQGFVPSTGRILDLVAPPGLRLDSGVGPGSEIGVHYDSMIAKLIAHGPDRDSARRALIEGLESLALPGVATNQAFLADCLRAPAFAAGAATTDFLPQVFPDGWQPDPQALEALRAGAAWASLTGGDGPQHRADAFRVTGRVTGGQGRVPVLVADAYGAVELTLIGPPPAAAPCLWPDAGAGLWICGQGLALNPVVTPLAEARMRGPDSTAAQGRLVAPLAGLISAVHVAPGDSVAQGEALVVMEAMKLVHTLTAPVSGRVARVACAVGDTIAAKTLLVEFEEQEEEAS